MFYPVKAAAAALCLFLIAGCVADDGLTGTGPVTLNARQKAHFEEWRTNSINRDPLYFFLVSGGRSYYVFCPDTAALCRDALEVTSQQECDARYGKGRCKLYGVYGKVVWKFDEPPDPDWHNNAESYRPPETPKDTRKITIRWEGRSEPVVGTMSYQRSSAAYVIVVIVRGVTHCDGRAEFARRTWSISCRNGVTAGGSFRPLGEGKGSVGEGIDTRGNRITFRVAPAEG